MGTTVDLTVMHTLHDAFRRDLEVLTRAAARAREGDPDAAERLRIGWSVLADQLHHHHEVEDDQLWPLVRASWGRSPDALDVLDAMEEEHAVVDPALAAVSDALADAYGDAAGPLDRLHAVVREHLAHEEAEAMPLITACVSPRDWGAFNARQARSLGLKGAAEFFPWLLQGQDDVRTERVLGVLPAPLRWAYRVRWEPRWAGRHRELVG
ncbi:hemerythrin domain-containing protein [Phycicoccus avicenniae]|uniref:hemerythrin domain-containing protein n=1 Tax=Phycicoccus avicenniae TaxID=2828860 RepID=UPI003D266DB7